MSSIIHRRKEAAEEQIKDAKDVAEFEPILINMVLTYVDNVSEKLPQR